MWFDSTRSTNKVFKAFSQKADELKAEVEDIDQMRGNVIDCGIVMSEYPENDTRTE